jgi:hypothetical protein
MQRTGSVTQISQLANKVLQADAAAMLKETGEVLQEMGEVIKPYVPQAASMKAKRAYIDIDLTMRNFQQAIEAHNEGCQKLGDKLREQHKVLLHRLVVLLSNTKALMRQQQGRSFFYVLNTDAKGIATLLNYLGKEGEKSIKAQIERLENLPSFLVFQRGDRRNNYRYLIGLQVDMVLWKTNSS